MDSQSTDFNGVDLELDSPSHDQVCEYLNDKLLIDPIEESSDGADLYCSVSKAAEILGRSERQVQRLLKLGKLSGHKTDGVKGPVWKVQKRDLINASNAALVAQSSASDCDQTAFDAKFDTLAREVQTIKIKVESLESATADSRGTKAQTYLIRSDVSMLKTQCAKTENLVKDLHQWKELADSLTSIAKRMDEQDEKINLLLAVNSKLPWWRRLFGGK